MGFLIKFVVFGAIALVTYIFALSNLEPVTIYLDPFTTEPYKAPLFVIFLVCIFVGVLFGNFLGRIFGFGTKLKLKQLRKKLELSEKQVENLKQELETQQDSTKLITSKNQ